MTSASVWILLLGLAAALFLPWMLLYRPAPPARGRGPCLDCRPPGHNAPQRAVLRVATYNIQGDCCDLERIARELESVDADVVGLQEVHNSFRRPRQLTWLARRLEMAVVHVPVRRCCGRYHRNNGLLTRLPVEEWQRFPIGPGRARAFYTGGTKRLIRQLLRADITAAQPVRILVAHLSTRKTDRMAGGRPAQLEQVLSELCRASPAVLLGDLNTTRDDPLIRDFLADDEATDALGDDDAKRVDWILVRGARVTATGKQYSGASDHPLYWCDVELDQTGRALHAQHDNERTGMVDGTPRANSRGR